MSVRVFAVIALIGLVIGAIYWTVAHLRDTWRELTRRGLGTEAKIERIAIRIGWVLLFVLTVIVLNAAVDKWLFFMHDRSIGGFLLACGLFYIFGKQKHRIDRLDEALRYLRKVDSSAASELADFLATEHNYNDPKTAYRLAAKLKQDSHPGWLRLGTCYEQEGKYDDAIAAYDKAITLKRDSAMAWLNLGDAYGQQGKHGEAVDAYRHVVKLKPNEAGGWESLGSAYTSQGKYDDAVAAYRRWAELKLTDSDPDVERTIAVYRRWAELKPDDPNVWYSLGWCYKKQGKLDDAVAAFHQMLKLKPDEPMTWYSLGVAYAKQGKRSESLDALDHLRKLDPSKADKLATLLSSK